MPRQRSSQTIFAGIEFDSKLEAERYMFLLSLKQEGDIQFLKTHPRFIIQVGYTLPRNELRAKQRVRGDIIYTADFEYQYKGIQVIEDVKGAYTNTRTSHKAGAPIVSAASKLRMNILQRRYPEMVFVMVTRSTWWWGETGGHKLL